MPDQPFDIAAFRAALDPEQIVLLNGAQPRGRLPQLSEAQLDLFARHAALVIEANRRFNLTAITDPVEMARKHYLDSLTCCLAVDFTALTTVCDIGTGAGYPAVPLAIAFPQVQFTLVESNNKKAQFLSESTAQLSLTNCQVMTARAEDLGQGPLRETFDLALARAVAILPALAEYCLPLVRVGGHFLAMRGQKADEELALVEHAFVLLGAEEPQTINVAIPEVGDRTLILVAKSSPTRPKYPRRAGMPTKRPLT